MIDQHRSFQTEKRPRRMPLDPRSAPRTTCSTPRFGPEACGSCRSYGKRRTVSHSSLDGADAVHRLHRLCNGLTLTNRLDRHGDAQAS